jgi:anti-anti-sigma factor
MALEIRTDRQPGLVRLALTGPVDLTGLARLRSAMAEAIDGAIDEGRSRVVVDLAGVGFLDSSGINALVGAYRAGKARGVGVTVVNAAGTVRRTLEVVGVYQVLADHGAVARDSAP